MVFWGMTLSLVNSKQCGGTQRLHLQGHGEWGVGAVRLYREDDTDGGYSEN